MPWEEQHCSCPTPDCPKERTFEAINFLGHLREEEYDVCKTMLLRNEELVIRLTWDSRSCEGGWGMELWKRIGYMLEQEPVFGERPGFKEIALLIIKQSCNGDAALEAFFRMRFALASDHGKSCWGDVLQKTIEEGLLPFSDKAKFSDPILPKSPTFIAIWSTWTEEAKQAAPNAEEEKECCICMDSKVNAIFSPCAHSDFCFACSRDLDLCPICRTKGYSKQKSKA